MSNREFFSSVIFSFYMLYYLSKVGEKMTIGENIRKIRKEKGLTQKQLGELCKINEVQIRQYELGKANPKIETINKIASALNEPLNYLLGIGVKEFKEVTAKTISFKEYLGILGYEVYESPYNDKWAIHIKDSNTNVYISSEEMNILERTTIENIDLRINKYLNDGKHNQ